MINLQPNSLLPQQNALLKNALYELRSSNHSLGRPLALCLMFESTENQALAASVFELAIALDTALHIPTEPILAAIRIQWWFDSIAKSSDQNVTLLAQLKVLFSIRHDFESEIQSMIEEWQIACRDESRESVSGWSAAWRLVAMQLGHKCTADQAAEIGVYLYNGTLQKRDISYCAGIPADIKSLRRNDQGDTRSWLYLASCLSKKILRDQTVTRQKNLRSHLEDPLMVWRIMCWYFFGPPR